MGWKWRKCSRLCSGLSLYNSRVIIYLLSPRHGYLKEDCAQAVAAVQICLPKDIISNDELGLSLFFAGSLYISRPALLDTSLFLSKLFPH